MSYSNYQINQRVNFLQAEITALQGNTGGAPDTNNTWTGINTFQNLVNLNGPVNLNNNLIGTNTIIRNQALNNSYAELNSDGVSIYSSDGVNIQNTYPNQIQLLNLNSGVNASLVLQDDGLDLSVLGKLKLSLTELDINQCFNKQKNYVAIQPIEV